MSESTTEDTQPDPQVDTDQAAASASSGETLGGSQPAGNSAEKDPSEWVSGDDPITGPQKSYLDSLARKAGEELPADMNKGEASQHIERLKDQLDMPS